MKSIDPSSSDQFFVRSLLRSKFSFILPSERNFPREQMTRMKRDRQDTTHGNSSKKYLGETLTQLFIVSRIAIVSKTSSPLQCKIF